MTVLLLSVQGVPMANALGRLGKMLLQRCFALTRVWLVAPRRPASG